MGDVTFPANILEQFNTAFPDIQETDHDRYGLRTPGDILAGNGSPAEKAVKIRDYFVHAESLNNVSVYRDTATTALSIRVGNTFRSAFSLNFANPEACFFTYPADHYNVPIPAEQCRLIRAAHPFVTDLKPDYLDATTWIRPEDKTVLIPPRDIQKANLELIRLANTAKVGTQMDTPAVMFDIFNPPTPLTLKALYGTKIDMPHYPFVRDASDSLLRSLTTAEIQALFATTNIPGKTVVSADNKMVSLVLDEKAANKPIAIQYGWIVNRTDMRGLPTDKQFLYYVADDDHIQWTALNSEQPVAIVDHATDAAGTKWLQVLTAKARGWVKAEDIAIMSKHKTQQLWTNPNVLTVTAPTTVINGHLLEMGTRLQIVSESKDSISVAIAKRAHNGYGRDVIKIRKSEMSGAVGNGTLYRGRVPFSRENMVKLLFRYLGTPWAMANERRGDSITFPNQGGNRQLGIDCSGIMEKAMDAMGLYAVSRSSKWQVRQGKVVWEKKTGTPSVEKALDQFKEAIWLIGMPGHVMFYLGKRDGVHWIIHSPGHFRKYESDTANFVRNGDGQVVVSPISLSDLQKKFDVLMSPL